MGCRFVFAFAERQTAKEIPMRRAMLFICLVTHAILLPALHAQDEGGDKSSLTYQVRPSFTFLMSTVQKPEGEALNMTLYFQLRSQCAFDVGKLHVRSYANIDLMRQAFSDAPPITMRDDLVMSLIPSVIISDFAKLSLFLEMTMETKLTNNEIDGVATRFMDPAFFYETLYIGQWYDWKSASEKHRISARYGLGYAFQQTVRNRFLLTDQRTMNLDPENPLSAVAQAPSVTLESGFSGLAAFEYNGELAENLTSFVQAFGVTLSKDLFSFTYRKSHAMLQLGAGMTYKLFCLRYDMRLAYDPNYSPRRQLDQTVSFGVQLEIMD
jgi:hypothetical protein